METVLVWPQQLYVVALVHLLQLGYFRAQLLQRGNKAIALTILFGFFYTIPTKIWKEEV